MKRFAPTSSCFLSEEAWLDSAQNLTVHDKCDEYLVHAYRLAVQFYLVHDFTRIFSIFFCQEFAKSISLVSHRYAVLREMHVHLQLDEKGMTLNWFRVRTDWAGLQHELPDDRVRNSFVQITLTSN